MICHSMFFIIRIITVVSACFVCILHLHFRSHISGHLWTFVDSDLEVALVGVKDDRLFSVVEPLHL